MQVLTASLVKYADEYSSLLSKSKHLMLSWNLRVKQSVFLGWSWWDVAGYSVILYAPQQSVVDAVREINRGENGDLKILP